MEIRTVATENHTMKTTLIIDHQVMRRLKADAARRGATISFLVETALRMYLDRKIVPEENLPPLPVYSGGKFLVDISNRETLLDFMDEDWLSSDRD